MKPFIPEQGIGAPIEPPKPAEALMPMPVVATVKPQVAPKATPTVQPAPPLEPPLVHPTESPPAAQLTPPPDLELIERQFETATDQNLVSIASSAQESLKDRSL